MHIPMSQEYKRSYRRRDASGDTPRFVCEPGSRVARHVAYGQIQNPISSSQKHPANKVDVTKAVAANKADVTKAEDLLKLMNEVVTCGIFMWEFLFLTVESLVVRGMDSLEKLEILFGGNAKFTATQLLEQREKKRKRGRRGRPRGKEPRGGESSGVDGVETEGYSIKQWLSSPNHTKIQIEIVIALSNNDIIKQRCLGVLQKDGVELDLEEERENRSGILKVSHLIKEPFLCLTTDLHSGKHKIDEPRNRSGMTLWSSSKGGSLPQPHGGQVLNIQTRFASSQLDGHCCNQGLVEDNIMTQEGSVPNESESESDGLHVDRWMA
ncbi:hypothetical protein Sjap_018144 [Stephania japonica]|uniref:Uncharacterized protein n=1 Tax=Stephania japonica TaxID=461633 RepID=A0AAP0I7F0_9MAGN